MKPNIFGSCSQKYLPFVHGNISNEKISSNVLNISQDFLDFARIFTCLEEQFREEKILKNSKKKLEFD